MEKREAGFESAVRDNYELMFRTAMGFVHSREDAEDIAQEVFLKAYRHWDSFRGEAEISTWLYRIAVNLSINFVKREKRRKTIRQGESMLKNLFNIAGNDKNPRQQLESEETDNAVRAAIDSLPEKQRTAFILSRYDELSQKETARIMQITEGAVEQLLQRAKKNLRKKLESTIGNNR